MTYRLTIIATLLSMTFVACGKNTPEKKEPAATGESATTSGQSAVAVSAADKTGAVAEAEGKQAAVSGESATAADNAPAKAGSESSDKRLAGPVALVNGKPISSERFYKKVDAVLKHNSRLPPERRNRVKQSFLKRLIEDELIHQAVQGEGVVAPKEAIEAEYEKYKKRFRTDEQFKQYLSRAKLTEADIRKRIEDKKLVWLLLEKKGNLSVTDVEAEEFYQKNKRFYEERETIKARHILVKVAKNAGKDVEKTALKKIQQAQAELKKGTPFEDVAKKFSEGPSAARGGMLTPFGKNQMVKPFEEKAFTMKANEVSSPVRTRHGFHIIEVLEHREARTKPFEEVKDGILDSLRNKKFFTARRKLVTDLREKAKIEKKIEFPVEKSPSTGAAPGLPHGHPPIHAKSLKPPTVAPVRTITAKPSAPASSSEAPGK